MIDGLIDEGTLEPLALAPEPVAYAPDPNFFQPDLTPAQASAANDLRATVAAGGFSVTLLDGVTGSGKTQVYFEAIAETLRQGRQGLVLVPEIALTAQFLDRFTARFGVDQPSGIPRFLPGGARAPGARSQRARLASSSARARRYFCPTPILGSSSSMRSMTRLTSRRTACVITPATWRWFARVAHTSRPCSSPRPRQ